MELPRPTPELVQQHIDGFEDETSGFGLVESALTKLFMVFPANVRRDEILLKVVALNRLYSTNIYNVHAVASHIHGLGIDARLRDGDLAVVPEIATVTIGMKEIHFYSFASKYCAWHEPEKYVLYDSYVDESLWRFNRQFHFAPFRRYELGDYSRFFDIVKQFRSFFNLNRFTLKQIDKFLWMFSQQT